MATAVYDFSGHALSALYGQAGQLSGAYDFSGHPVSPEGQTDGIYQATATVTYAAGEGGITVADGVPEQTVSLSDSDRMAFVVNPDSPGFTNAFDKDVSMSDSSPYTFGCTWYMYAQRALVADGGVEGGTFTYGHTYFMAFNFTGEIDEYTVVLSANGVTDYVTPTMTRTFSEPGWVYIIKTPTSYYMGNAITFENTGTGTAKVINAYAIDLTEAGITYDSITDLIDLWGALDIRPGQDYEGNQTGGVVTVSKNGVVLGTNQTLQSLTVSGGDTVSATGGSLVFRLSLGEVSDNPLSLKKWAAVGDSLTDTTINADYKYQQLIADSTGISVRTYGKGGTGYWQGLDAGSAYGQRVKSIQADCDIVTLLGSVNDHKVDLGTTWAIPICKDADGADVSGTDYDASADYPYTDTVEDGTFCGYVNWCISNVRERAPLAKIIMLNGVYYRGVHESVFTVMWEVMRHCAQVQGVTFIDLYHSTYAGILGKDNPYYDTVAGHGLSFDQITEESFGEHYTTDYSANGSTYGHPSNAYHAEWIAPQVAVAICQELGIDPSVLPPSLRADV